MIPALYAGIFLGSIDMLYERKMLLTKLTGFSIGELSKQEIYEWALNVAVSSDFENLTKSDGLVEQIFQYLLNINKPRQTAVDSKKILAYFIDCLESRKTYSADEYNSMVSVKPVMPRAPGPAPSLAAKSGPAVKILLPVWLVSSARIYALLFILGSLGLNIFSIIKPDFLINANEIAPTAQQAARDATPHLFYGILIFVALFARLPRFMFLIFIPVAIWGMFFYWSAATGYVLKHGLSFFSAAILLVFVALPPTAVFFILLLQWFAGMGEKNQ